jgi:hypothetical protein
MARKLINLKLAEVALVDSPANPGATVLLYKRAEEGGSESVRVAEIQGKSVVIDKNGHPIGRFIRWQDMKTKGQPVEKGIDFACPNCETPLQSMYQDGEYQIPNFCGECGASLSLMATGGNMQKKKEKSKMPEFKKEDLTPEAKAYVEGIEKELKDSIVAQAELSKRLETATKKEEPEDIWKGVNPAVKKQFEEMQTKTAEAERIAKSEREARELSEFTKKAEKEFSYLPGEAAAKGKILQAVNSKLSKEETAELEKLLKAADEIAKSGKVFSEMGATGSGNIADSDSAEGQINARAAELVSKGVVKTIIEGISKIAKEDPSLYESYRKEVVRRAN